ncbi:MAG: hypothetical protein KIT10_05255 [Flavobacteriales bacterium]|nr:hypothetical protein [Flavobacteriales bacterium]
MSYKQRIQEALKNRHGSAPGKIIILVIIASVITLSLLALCIVAAPEGLGASYHFYDERGAVTALSALCMAWGGAFALVTALQMGREPFRTRLFWSLAAAGLAFMAVDELVGFHEAIGDVTPGVETSGERVFGIFRGWNDIIVILYGVVALLAGLWFLPEVLRPPRFAELIALGFAAFVAHTVIDSISEPPSHTSVILEESAKVYCVLFMALAMFTAMRWALGRRFAGSIG